MLRILALSLLLFTSRQALGTDPVTSGRQNPEGVWTATSAQRNGAAASELVGNRIEFAAGRFQISKQRTVLFAGSFTTNLDEIPAQIDFKIEEGSAKGQSWLGIFKFEAGGLTICDNAPSPTAPRPHDFDSSKGSGYVCLIFER
jgi:uncharacterized protein (TIGR03067 family)